MAKESLLTHRKFAHLCALLREDAVLVLGRLEMIYLTAHTAASPVYGGPEEVEAVAQWRGEPGALAAALVRAKLMDAQPGGELHLHDYWDHAPRYVAQRVERRSAPNGAKQRDSAPTGAKQPPTDPDPDSQIGDPPIREAQQQETGGRRSRPPKTRGGDAAPAAEILRRLTAGQRSDDPRMWSDEQVLRALVKLDRANPADTARKNWGRRLRELHAHPGGPEFIRRALHHAKEAQQQRRTDHGPPLANIASFINSETRKWLAGQATETDK